MGKIAYGRRRTEKKTGTRNETHVVEQSDFPVYEGIHEAIISEEYRNLAQEKQLSVLNASLYQAETIKTRLEQQMDNLDVTDTHYDKKISDLQRRLDAQYDRIDEVEETMAELKSQIYELKKNQIDADSIYGFLGAFNEMYSECTDAEKKQFMQAFIERIDIFSERREDGNWIQNIKFQFPVPIIKEGKEVAQIKGISLDKEKSDEHMASLEKLSTLESCVLLCRADT